MKRPCLMILAMAATVAAMTPLEVGAETEVFDSSISNDFWCTWGRVNHVPAGSASSACATFVFSGPSAGASECVAPFIREPLKGTCIKFR